LVAAQVETGVLWERRELLCCGVRVVAAVAAVLLLVAHR
jgi:hypothetical protein